MSDAETLPPEERRPLQLLRSNPLSNLWLLFSHGQALRRLSLARLFFTIAQTNNATIIGSFRLGPLGFSPMDLSKYLQFTSPVHGLLQGNCIGPITAYLGARRAGAVGTLVKALGFTLWGCAWLVPGLYPRMVYYGVVQALTINTWSMMAELSTSTRLMKTGIEQTPYGKGELSAALSGLSLLVSVALPPLSGRLYSWFTQPGGPAALPAALRGVGPTGSYVVSSLLCVLSWAALRSVRDEDSEGAEC